MSVTLRVRVATKEDLDEICEIQRECYERAFWESRECFEGTIEFGRSLVADAPGVGGVGSSRKPRVVGYVLIHSFEENGAIPPLGATKDRLPPWNDARVWIHDLCVGRAYRGTGVARALVETAIRANTGADVRLVSLNERTHSFWWRMGFYIFYDERRAGGDDASGAGYGETARTMILDPEVSADVRRM